jgi:hypothetical protein
MRCSQQLAVNGWLWNELGTPESEAATRFYERLASYRVTANEGGHRVYHVFEAGGHPRRSDPADGHQSEAQ